MAEAAPPVNDNFASRQVVSGAAVNVTGTNVEATMEAGENDLGGLYGATVWYRWSAPASGWVRVETTGSAIDTVVRVTTGTTLPSLVLVGYNDDDPDGVGGTSSLTFLAVAGQTYNIALGGYRDAVGPATGAVRLRVATGAAALPAVVPVALSFDPASVDVSVADAVLTANYRVQAGTFSGVGYGYLSFVRADGTLAEMTDTDWRDWDTRVALSGSPYLTVAIPRGAPAGVWGTILELETEAGDYLRFGEAGSGEAYVLPAVAGVATTLTVTSAVTPRPGNDDFAAAEVLSGVAATVGGTNAGATLEAGEDDLNGLYGATVWYRWTPPGAGWVKVDTVGSSFDTVIRVSTGGTLAGQTVIGYNDQGGGIGDASSLTFLAEAGVSYRIAVGGWPATGPATGDFVLNVASGAAALPLVVPVAMTVSPGAVNVTGAAAVVRTDYRVAAGSYDGPGSGFLGFVRPDGALLYPRETASADWDTDLPGSGGPFASVTVPRYAPPGEWRAVLSLQTPSGSVVFGGAQTGQANVLPAAMARTLTVTNTGSVDTEAAVLSSISAAPLEVAVAAAAASVVVSAELGDNLAGVTEVYFGVESELGLTLETPLVRTAGTALSGTWSGTLVVPKGWPTGVYAVYLLAYDGGGNLVTYGTAGGDEAFPGGSLYLDVDGGGFYSLWAYQNWFGPGALLTGPGDDPGGDGVNNLMCYAFDLNPYDFRDSQGFLPEVGMTGSGAGSRLRIRYLRHKPTGSSGLVYVAQFGNGAGAWENATSVPVVTDLGGDWEEVVVTDAVTAVAAGRRFGRVRVTYTD